MLQYKKTFTNERIFMKRIISCYPSDFEQFTKDEFKQAIEASEGRTIVAETVVTAAPLLEGVTNAEVMAAFGADLIILNEFDVFTKEIHSFTAENPIAELKCLTGRPIGINLEPVDQTGKLLEEQISLPAGRCLNPESLIRARKLGVDFILLTGNPATGVTVQSILEAIPLAKEYFGGLIFAGKMHGAGVKEDLLQIKTLTDYIKQGADGVLIPAPGTVPGVTEELAHQAIQAIHQLGGLTLASIGTSQESADEDTIRSIALSNKRAGFDLHHIGDGGYGRMPIPENITALSIAVKGKRHTYFKMAQSVRR